MRCAVSTLVLVMALTGPSIIACGDQARPAEANPDQASSPGETAPPRPQTQAQQPPPPTPAAPAAPAAEPGTVVFAVDGVERRLEVREPGHATINRLSALPTVAVLAQAEPGASESLILKIGGVDLDRASLPLELHGGGPAVSFTYVDEVGVRHTGQIEERSPDDRLTIEAWDATALRLRARFTATLTASGSTRSLTQGSFDVVLHDPFGNR